MADEPANLPAVPDDASPAPIDASYEIALDDAPDGVAGPVHAPGGLPMAQEAPTRLPVIPEQYRSLAAVKKEVRRHAGRHWHRARFHGVRSPGYLLRGCRYAVAGACRVVAVQGRWAWVAESKPVRDQLAKGDPGKWVSAHEHVLRVRRTRIPLLLGEAVVLAAGCVVLALIAPWWSWALAAVTAFPLLARAGRPAGKPIITPAQTTPRFRILNGDVVLRAYYAAGLGSGDPKKPDQKITFGAPGMTRDGEGSRVLVDLPYGKGLDDALKAKPAIASGLDVALSQVFITRDPTSHRRHVLWVADRDPLAVPVGRTPLLACRPTDIWRAAPFGLDERGGLVTVPLMWNSVLVAALARAGKTFAARSLALYCALDPYVKLDVFDFKGSPDWRKFALVASSCAFGLTPTRDGLPLHIFGDTLMEIKADVQDRYERLSQMDTKVCPEGKLTREIARDPRYRMPVRVLVLEEFQEVYESGKDALEAAKLLTYLIKVAPGAGVILIGSTQKPSGVGGSGEVGQQFTNFRDNFQIRFGLRTSSWQVSEVCLGAGAYSEGLDTSTLLKEYRGVGILRGASDRSPTVRTYLADGLDAERILKAARVLRERAGTLGGMAAGESVQQAARDVLADVLAAFEGDSRLHWELLAERLARRFPDRWGDVTGDTVSAQCRALGVRSADVRWPPGRSGAVRKGCYKEDVEIAAARDTAGQEDDG